MISTYDFICDGNNVLFLWFIKVLLFTKILREFQKLCIVKIVKFWKDVS